MATANSTANPAPNRVGVDLVEPFGVRLNGIVLEEHGSALAALEFAERLRTALRVKDPDGANIIAADLAGRRLTQAAGVLRTLWHSGAFGALEEDFGPMTVDAVDAACALLDQGLDAVRSLNFASAP